MLYAVVIFVIAIIGALFAFLGMTAEVSDTATLAFFIFESLFVISLIAGVGRRGG